MPSKVCELLSTKGSAVETITPGCSVLEAARRMNSKRIGALVVQEGAGSRISGIITERDILNRVVATASDTKSTRVEDVMTSPIITCSPDTRLDDVRSVMKSRRIRHVPVVEKDELIGIVSLSDLNEVEVKIMTETIGFLEQYVNRGA